MDMWTGASPWWDHVADLSFSVLKSEFARVEPFAHATELFPVRIGYICVSLGEASMEDRRDLTLGIELFSLNQTYLCMYINVCFNVCRLTSTGQFVGSHYE